MLLIDAGAFNWTKVELKLVESRKSIMFVLSFNWTKVELKLVLMKKPIAIISLLIELR